MNAYEGQFTLNTAFPTHYNIIKPLFTQAFNVASSQSESVLIRWVVNRPTTCHLSAGLLGQGLTLDRGSGETWTCLGNFNTEWRTHARKPDLVLARFACISLNDNQTNPNEPNIGLSSSRLTSYLVSEHGELFLMIINHRQPTT